MKSRFFSKKFRREIFQVKSRGYDVTSLYQCLSCKELLAVEIGTGGLRLQNYQSFRKLQNRGFIGVIKVCQLNLGFIK